jgi:hypothetical protein
VHMAKIKNKTVSRFYEQLHDLMLGGFISDLQIVDFRNYTFRLVNQLEISGIDCTSVSFSSYKILITDNGIIHPTFKMVEPDIDVSCPHVYPNSDLCLFHRKEFSWSRGSIVGKRIILVLYSWILFYDIWLVTKIWYGKEAKHKLQK